MTNSNLSEYSDAINKAEELHQKAIGKKSSPATRAITSSQRTSQDFLPTSDAKEAIKKRFAGSSQTLTDQAIQLTDRMDDNDLDLARQIVNYVSDRPNRFLITLAKELLAVQPAQPEEEFFLDIGVADFERPSLGARFREDRAIAASTAEGSITLY